MLYFGSKKTDRKKDDEDALEKTSFSASFTHHSAPRRGGGNECYLLVKFPWRNCTFGSKLKMKAGPWRDQAKPLFFFPHNKFWLKKPALRFLALFFSTLTKRKIALFLEKLASWSGFLFDFGYPVKTII